MTSALSLEIIRLFPQVWKAHHTLVHPLFSELGLYRGQHAILEVLWEQDGRTQTELSGALHIQPATVTKMLQRMEQAGFLARCADPDDQRVSRVYLTQQGRDVRPAVLRILETLADESLKGFTLEELVLLRRFMLQMRDNLWASDTH
jgi:DNA-binding MarR family transcriptional regulator